MHFSIVFFVFAAWETSLPPSKRSRRRLWNTKPCSRSAERERYGYRLAKNRYSVSIEFSDKISDDLFFPFQALISDFIYVDHQEQPSLQEGSSSCSDGKREQQQDELEGQVMAIEERWFVLCSWLDDRGAALRRRLEFAQETEALSEWMARAEGTLRGMEHSPTEESSKLLLQAKEIRVGQKINFPAFFTY